MAKFIAMESSRKIYNCNRFISDITNHAYQHKRRKLHKSIKSPLYLAMVGTHKLLGHYTLQSYVWPISLRI
ncbi:hypothetical protein L211DRAFT_834162, partial [Terfezia boudieri ATCC MYA-4762]